MAEKWTCSYCKRHCTVGDKDRSRLSDYKYISAEYGNIKSVTDIIVCPNPDCREKTITVNLFNVDYNGGNSRPIHYWALLPESSAKPFPKYIPYAIRTDYEEACLIKDKSPKASATLSRRCLQAMIRDFWGVEGETLYTEFQALEDKIEPMIWTAIKSVQEVGKIGANMKEDINFIVDVEPEEVGMLIGLIEILLEEWYIRSHERELRMKKITQLGDNNKDKMKQASPTQEAI